VLRNVLRNVPSSNNCAKTSLHQKVFITQKTWTTPKMNSVIADESSWKISLELQPREDRKET
jgi:hypothetical protein